LQLEHSEACHYVRRGRRLAHLQGTVDGSHILHGRFCPSRRADKAGPARRGETGVAAVDVCRSYGRGAAARRIPGAAAAVGTGHSRGRKWTTWWAHRFARGPHPWPPLRAHPVPTFLPGLFGSTPLLFPRFGETPLLFVYSEICHWSCLTPHKKLTPPKGGNWC
jgi:hypothetical protein